jgi:hypothetical protein
LSGGSLTAAGRHGASLPEKLAEMSIPSVSSCLIQSQPC